jgi:hypothetical protein
MISIEDLVQYRLRNETLVERGAETRLSTSSQSFLSNRILSTERNTLAVPEHVSH